MLKKTFAILTALFLIVFAAGCGGGDNGGGETKKAASEKPQYSADKAVLAYAEMYAFGVSDNLKEAGLTEKDAEDVSEEIIGGLVQQFSQFPLSDESVAQMVGVYDAKLMAAMNIQATLKKDDDESPIVSLSARTINNEAANEMASSNEDMLALGVAVGQLESEGMTLDDLKANADFQKAAMECIDNFINEIPLNAEKSIDVPCEKVEGSDGKLYWAPKDPAAVKAFVDGK